MARSLKLKIFALGIISAAMVRAQGVPVGPPVQITPVSVAPSGPCGSTQMRLLTPDGTLYGCANGTWKAISGSGSSSLPLPFYTYSNPTIIPINIDGEFDNSAGPIASQGTINSFVSLSGSGTQGEILGTVAPFLSYNVTGTTDGLIASSYLDMDINSGSGNDLEANYNVVNISSPGTFNIINGIALLLNANAAATTVNQLKGLSVQGEFGFTGLTIPDYAGIDSDTVFGLGTYGTANGVSSFQHWTSGTATNSFNFFASAFQAGDAVITNAAAYVVERVFPATNLRGFWITNQAADWAEATNAWGFANDVPELASYTLGPYVMGKQGTASNTWLEMAAGTTSRVSLLLDSGTLSASVINGGVEYDGTHFYESYGSTRYVVGATLSGSGSITLGTIADGSCASGTFTLTGAAVGDKLAPTWPSGLSTGFAGIMLVTSSSTVTASACNFSGSPQTPGALTFAASLIR